MCGIVGYIGKKTNAIETIISGLEALEYRGYDSAGIAYLTENKVNIVKKQGRIENLKFRDWTYTLGNSWWTERS